MTLVTITASTSVKKNIYFFHFTTNLLGTKKHLEDAFFPKGKHCGVNSSTYF